MSDGGAEILKFAAGHSPMASSGHIFLAGPFVQVTQLFCAKVVKNSA
jgi:hypothetical protein